MGLISISKSEVTKSDLLKIRRSYLDDSDVELFNYWWRTNEKEGQFFSCRCGHLILQHKKEIGPCKWPHCKCLIFLEQAFVITWKGFLKNPLSLEFFCENIANNLRKNSKEWWKCWEDYINVFGDLKCRKIKH